MSDPAVEAAFRANEQYYTDGTIVPVSIAAAREALKPIRNAMEVARTRYEMLEFLVEHAAHADAVARGDRAAADRLAEAAVARFRAELGVDLRALRLTDEGFVRG